MSFLERHITNPVYLKDMRRLKREWIFSVFLFVIFFISFIWPASQYIYQSLYPDINLASDHGLNVEKFVIPVQVEFWSLGLFMIILVLPTALPILMGFNYRTPQREYTQHGKLQPKTLLKGARKTAWTVWGLSYLALVPGGILVSYMVWGSDVNSLLMMSSVLLCLILVSLFIIEGFLCCLAIGPVGGWAVCCLFTLLLFAGGVHLARSTMWMHHMGHLFFGWPLQEGLASITVAQLPWGPLAAVSLQAISLLACAMITSHMLLQPRRSNREIPFRIAITATVAIHLICTVYLERIYVFDPQLYWTGEYTGKGPVVPMEIFLALCCIMGTGGMCAGLGEGTGPLSQRVRREIPTGKWRRWLAYPFFWGPDSRIIWCAGLILIIAITGTALKVEYWKPLFGISFMLLAWFLQVAVLIQKNPGAGPEELMRTFGKFTLTHVMIPVILVSYFLNQSSEAAAEALFLKILFPVGIILFLIQIVRCHKWFLKRWGDFKPAPMETTGGEVR